MGLRQHGGRAGDPCRSWRPPPRTASLSQRQRSAMSACGAPRMGAEDPRVAPIEAQSGESQLHGANARDEAAIGPAESFGDASGEAEQARIAADKDGHAASGGAIGFDRRQRRGNVPFDGRSLLARAVGKKVEQSPAADQRLGRGDRPGAASVRCSAAPGPQPTTKMWRRVHCHGAKSPAAPSRAPDMSTNSTATGKSLSPRRPQIRRRTDSRIRSASGVGQEELLGRRQGGENAFDRRTLRGGAANRLGVQPGERFRGRPGTRPVRVPLPRGELRQLARMADQQDRLEGGGREAIQGEAPGVAHLDALLVAEREMLCARPSRRCCRERAPGSERRRPRPRPVRIAANRKSPCRNTAARSPSCRGSTGRLQFPAAD